MSLFHVMKLSFPLFSLKLYYFTNISTYNGVFHCFPVKVLVNSVQFKCCSNRISQNCQKVQHKVLILKPDKTVCAFPEITDIFQDRLKCIALDPLWILSHSIIELSLTSEPTFHDKKFGDTKVKPLH